MSKKLPYIFLFVILLVVDLLSKFYYESVFGSEKISLIGDLLYLEKIKNDGIAFGIDIPFLKFLTIILISIIIIYFWKFEKKKKNKFVNISFILILSGAIGNAFERLFFGKVTDFIGVKYFSVFNFADICITLGVFLYILIIILKKDGNCDTIDKV